jgi:Domain of unknown function (DUF4352)
MSLLKYQKSHYVMIGLLFLLLLVVTACGGSDNNSTSNTATATPTVAANNANSAATAGSGQDASAPSTPVAITPNSSSGSAGTGPVVINTPIPVAGGGANSQQVTLADRQLLITSANRQSTGAAGSTTITLVITVKNTSGKAIKNQADFFQLMGAEGDAFSQANSSDNFYGTILAHSARSGTIIFRMPSAAATKLRLLYRSEIASETVITDLNV